MWTKYPLFLYPALLSDTHLVYVSPGAQHPSTTGKLSQSGVKLLYRQDSTHQKKKAGYYTGAPPVAMREAQRWATLLACTRAEDKSPDNGRNHDTSRNWTTR